MLAATKITLKDSQPGVVVYDISAEDAKAAFAEDIVKLGLDIGLSRWLGDCDIDQGTQGGAAIVSVCYHDDHAPEVANQKNTVFPFATTTEKAAFADFLIQDFTDGNPMTLLHPSCFAMFSYD